MDARHAVVDGEQIDRVLARLGKRCIVLVGMMGAGKTSIGRRLANLLHLPFLDADAEIEKAANQTIAEIFAALRRGAFPRRRAARRGAAPGERAGGAGDRRRRLHERGDARALPRDGVTVWLKADVPVLLERVRKKGNRPLLNGADPEAVMRRLLAEREPIYALADIVVASREGPHQAVVAEIIAALDAPSRAREEPDVDERRDACASSSASAATTW